jgi:hypothetical protein
MREKVRVESKLLLGFKTWRNVELGTNREAWRKVLVRTEFTQSWTF